MSTSETDPSLFRDVPPAQPLEEWAQKTLGPLTPPLGPVALEHPWDLISR